MKEGKINISVLIPAYNMAEYVGESIRSALDAGLESVEVIVIDDGSTDGTRSVVEAYTDHESPDYDRRVRYESQANRGKSVAVNRGLEIARGDYVTVLDADDRIPPSGLSSRFEARFGEDGRACDLVIGACEVFRDGETLHVWETPERTNPMRLRRGFYLFPRQPFHLNACLMSRELAERTGPVNTDRERCQDIDYALRLLENARRIATTDKVTYRYRKYRSSFQRRLRLRLKTLFHRLMVVSDNFDGMDRIVGIIASLSFDSLKLLYEMLAGTYPKRAAGMFSQV